MFLLTEKDFVSFIYNVNWGTVCVCKAGEMSGLGRFVDVKDSNQTLENPVDCPDVSKHERLKRLMKILRISNVVLPSDKVDTLNVGDISLSIIASNQAIITLTAIYDLFLGHANIVEPIKSLRLATICTRGKDIITLNLWAEYMAMYDSSSHSRIVSMISLNLAPKSAYFAIASPNCYMYLVTRLYFKKVHTFEETSYYQIILFAMRTCVLETINPDTETLNLDKISIAKFKELAEDMNIKNKKDLTDS
ncbi:hypothetical protein A3Q56_07597 [Intoshia linei]|uniref:Uncharacterized protein n=1 Tax=Intoshia linei TaxID=1819745 RepID=A0A177ARS0_9BILA|nr:hypothetical protein A3Q56_07597 [Intoshia linei]